MLVAERGISGKAEEARASVAGGEGEGGAAGDVLKSDLLIEETSQVRCCGPRARPEGVRAGRGAALRRWRNLVRRETWCAEKLGAQRNLVRSTLTAASPRAGAEAVGALRGDGAAAADGARRWRGRGAVAGAGRGGARARRALCCAGGVPPPPPPPSRTNWTRLVPPPSRRAGPGRQRCSLGARPGRVARAAPVPPRARGASAAPAHAAPAARAGRVDERALRVEHRAGAAHVPRAQPGRSARPARPPPPRAAARRRALTRADAAPARPQPSKSLEHFTCLPPAVCPVATAGNPVEPENCPYLDHWCSLGAP